MNPSQLPKSLGNAGILGECRNPCGMLESLWDVGIQLDNLMITRSHFNL